MSNNKSSPCLKQHVIHGLTWIERMVTMQYKPMPLSATERVMDKIPDGLVKQSLTIMIQLWGQLRTTFLVKGFGVWHNGRVLA